jgi:hypothetical protein
MTPAPRGVAGSGRRATSSSACSSSGADRAARHDESLPVDRRGLAVARHGEAVGGWELTIRAGAAASVSGRRWRCAVLRGRASRSRYRWCVARPVDVVVAIPLETRQFEDLGALAAIPLGSRQFEDLGCYSPAATARAGNRRTPPPRNPDYVRVAARRVVEHGGAARRPPLRDERVQRPCVWPSLAR